MLNSTPMKKSPLPKLDELYRRHPGLTESLCKAFADAATVCLSGHHQPPTELHVSAEESNSLREIQWNAPTAGVLRAWANTIDATECGAYSISLAAVEAELGHVAIHRAETRSGADYYIGPSERSVDLEVAYRLEVSGVDSGDFSVVRRRINEKVRQAQLGRSSLPALASVVGFLAKCVVIKKVPS